MAGPVLGLGEIQDYWVSVDIIKAMTGLDFFRILTKPPKSR
ncbi:hypothetical protein [Fodinibius saliphilus]|nr:hypothetical protein [Fodinibius saliphilus]